MSYKLYRSKKEKIKRDLILEFYEEYSDTFIISYSFQDLLSILTNAVILKQDEGYYYFSYKYLSFYLTAKKISTLLNTDEGVTIIKKLCCDLHLETNANILVFLTHHTNNNELLEEIMYSSLLPFENFKPITLEPDDSFFKFLSDFVETIKNDILPENSCPKKNREKSLAKQDEMSRRNSESDTKQKDDTNKEMAELSDMFKIF
ncbi:STAND family AAA ATPase [Labilibaculum euxinus]|uniref:STAND NTPase 4 small alpha/beta domain-containing protein n=1 Tax=Labilibaculum euxinus TaxID=2686357 RepID=A0A7M4D1A4_9BACT|nr:hypothetical protein [Labilibaculum euxinus]MUP36433.1 hypothetical protein [Labilibaculum euxinus]MVB05638.1 hypothetical protein [Labilibaculum euxinus]